MSYSDCRRCRFQFVVAHEDARENPQVGAQLERHRLETEGHAAEIERALLALGSSTSAIKTTAGGLLGFVEGLSTAVCADQSVRNLLMDCAMEHFEIACYTSLIVAAEQEGLVQMAESLRQILRDERKMAAWLESQIESVTTAHLRRVAVAAG